MNQAPPANGRAVSRLLDHCARLTVPPQDPLRAKDRLEAEVGGELAHRLVGALAGDHRIPARVSVD